MKKGDKIRSVMDKSWKGVVLKKTVWGFLIRWETGPLAGKSANVMKAYIERDQ